MRIVMILDCVRLDPILETVTDCGSLAYGKLPFEHLLARSKAPLRRIRKSAIYAPVQYRSRGSETKFVTLSGAKRRVD